MYLYYVLLGARSITVKNILMRAIFGCAFLIYSRIIIYNYIHMYYVVVGYVERFRVNYFVCSFKIEYFHLTSKSPTAYAYSVAATTLQNKRNSGITIQFRIFLKI